MTRKIFKNLTLGLFALSLIPAAQAATKVARPPQYVMVGFDGGLNVPFWREMDGFSKTLTKSGKPLNFTYFFSGVYLLQPSKRMLYKGPGHKQGYSMISFGDSADGISERVNFMNTLYKSGADIASHGNGHFPADEEKWNSADWNSEFTQYNDLVFNAFYNNDITPNNSYPHGFAFDAKDIVGFRAPYLGSTADLFPVLKSFGYKYDASTTGEMGEWPRKDKYGIWRYPVPLLKIAGTAKKSLAMDYNFYWVQSKAVEDGPNRDLYRKQMYDSYMNYFQSSFYGARGPVYIGHHFVKYNGGAYWEALKDFTRTVCGKPEVRCVSFKDYTMWLESLTPDVFRAYAAGNFDQMPETGGGRRMVARNLDMNLSLITENDVMEFQGSGADFKQTDLKTVLSVNSIKLPGQKVSLKELRRRFAKAGKVAVSTSVYDRNGVEIQRLTHVVKNLGTPEEFIEPTSEENKALMGDMPEAHLESPGN